MHHHYHASSLMGMCVAKGREEPRCLVFCIGLSIFNYSAVATKKPLKRLEDFPSDDSHRGEATVLMRSLREFRARLWPIET